MSAKIHKAVIPAAAPVAGLLRREGYVLASEERRYGVALDLGIY